MCHVYSHIRTVVICALFAFKENENEVNFVKLQRIHEQNVAMGIRRKHIINWAAVP